MELSSLEYLDKQLPAEQTSVPITELIEMVSEYFLDILESWRNSSV
jgi:hypothetical protein